MDLISRQAAIEAIKEDKIDLTNPNVVAVFKATGDFEKVETQVMTCDRHIEILKDLPSAQPERKQGQWVGIDDEPCETWECDQCGYIQEFFDGDQPNYCSNCGADMREDEQE